MDLQEIHDKLNEGVYKTFTHFRNDFKLIVNNCRLYNGQNNGKKLILFNFFIVRADYR